MKTKAIALAVLGIAGIIFVLLFDVIMGKSVNDVSGPKSISALIVSGLLVVLGFYFMFKGPKENLAGKK